MDNEFRHRRTFPRLKYKGLEQKTFRQQNTRTLVEKHDHHKDHNQDSQQDEYFPLQRVLLVESGQHLRDRIVPVRHRTVVVGAGRSRVCCRGACGGGARQSRLSLVQRFGLQCGQAFGEFAEVREVIGIFVVGMLRRRPGIPVRVGGSSGGGQ